MTITPEDLRARIALAKTAAEAAPAQWRQGSRANADYYMGTHSVVSEDRVLLECNVNFIPEGRALAAHIVANHPQAVIDLCETLIAHKQSIHGLLDASAKQYAELLAAREEIAALHALLIEYRNDFAETKNRKDATLRTLLRVAERQPHDEAGLIPMLKEALR